jgi:hypothetical protein
MCARRVTSTSGGGSLIHCFRPVLPIGSYPPRGWKVVLSSRLMEVKLLESTRSGVYEVWMCRSDGSGLIQLTHFDSVTELHAGRPTGNKSPSILALLEIQTSLSSILRVVRRANLPVNLRTKSCQVGRGMVVGYISHQIALAVGTYGRRFRQVDRLRRHITVDLQRSNARRRIFVLCKGSNRSWIMAHSD